MRKYRNKITLFDGLRFDSKLEAKRYIELKLMEKAREICEITVHPRYQLFVGAEFICTYVADFSYYDKGGELHIEDVKGVRTGVYLLKKKLLKACLNLDVEEVRKKR